MLRKKRKFIFEKEGTMQFKDVRQIVTLAMDLHGIVFPHPGEYRFQLFAGGYLLGERRITCRKIKLPPRAGANEHKED